MQVSVHQDAVFTCKVLTLVLREVHTLDSYFLSPRFSLLSSTSLRAVLSIQSLSGDNLFCLRISFFPFLMRKW